MLLLRGFKMARQDSGDASHVSGVETCSHLLRRSRKGRGRIKKYEPSPSSTTAYELALLDITTSREREKIHTIIFAFRHDLTLRLNLCFVAELFQRSEVVYDCLNKSLLEVTMNNTGSLWRLGAISDCPLSDFISTSGEETSQIQD